MQRLKSAIPNGSRVQKAESRCSEAVPQSRIAAADRVRAAAAVEPVTSTDPSETTARPVFRPPNDPANNSGPPGVLECTPNAQAGTYLPPARDE